jgi:hypothetical protein
VLYSFLCLKLCVGEGLAGCRSWCKLSSRQRKGGRKLMGCLQISSHEILQRKIVYNLYKKLQEKWHIKHNDNDAGSIFIFPPTHP